MRRALLAAAVVLLLAGCNGFGGTPTRTATPAPVPTVGEDARLAPGVTGEGVTDPSALGEAHARVVENTSYRLMMNRSVRFTNGTRYQFVGFDIRLAADRDYRLTLRTAGPGAPGILGSPPASAEFYGDGETYVRALTRENRTTYSSYAPPNNYVGTWDFWVSTFAFGAPARTDLAVLFGSIETRIAGVETVDDRRILRVVGSRVVSPAFVDGPYDDPRNLRLRARIDERGLVRAYRLRYRATYRGEPVVVRRTVHYEGVGNTTVERPPWFDRAVQS